MSGTESLRDGHMPDADSVAIDAYISALFTLYLLLLPFAHWLAPSGWLPLPNIPLLCAAALLPFSRRARIQIVWRDVVLFALAIVGVLSTLANADTITGKSVNHMTALLFVTFLNYFVGGRFLFCYLRDNWHRPLFLGFVFACALCVFEFVLVNYFHTPLPGHRPNAVEYGSTFILGVRPRSTFSESGHFAFYLACVVPLLIVSFREAGNRAAQRMVLLCMLICATLLFSTTLFMVMVLWGFMYAVFRKLHLRSWGLLAICFCIGVLILFAPAVLEATDILVLHKFRTDSFDDRQQKFEAVMHLISQADAANVLFGHGMGAFSGLHMEDSISSYVNFARDTGFLGAALFLLALVPVESFQRHAPRAWRRTFLLVGMGLIVYFTAVPNYFFPHFAFTLGLMSSMGSQEWQDKQPNGWGCT